MKVSQFLTFRYAKLTATPTSLASLLKPQVEKTIVLAAKELAFLVAYRERGTAIIKNKDVRLLVQRLVQFDVLF